MSDVWQDISRSHLLGCQLGLFGTMVNYGLYSTKSRRDGLAVAEKMECQKGWKLGAVVTDNAGKCKRAILALRHPRLSYIPCMAHDTNNLVNLSQTQLFVK
ncbi:hypothetical protein PHMEG_00012491 [Phytophthora megakarya]|uniref:DUF659 domain-containing protein n=1 Tax=Phytophthora megakarya TaxID=4795 RepID=A0A225W8L7_9STRA|nr:hypothetical protein PHMEG_00012491 [Phytophthora megakarya]